MRGQDRNRRRAGRVAAGECDSVANASTYRGGPAASQWCLSGAVSSENHAVAAFDGRRGVVVSCLYQEPILRPHAASHLLPRFATRHGRCRRYTACRQRMQRRRSCGAWIGWVAKGAAHSKQGKQRHAGIKGNRGRAETSGTALWRPREVGGRLQSGAAWVQAKHRWRPAIHTIS